MTFDELLGADIGTRFCLRHVNCVVKTPSIWAEKVGEDQGRVQFFINNGAWYAEIDSDSILTIHDDKTSIDYPAVIMPYERYAGGTWRGTP